MRGDGSVTRWIRDVRRGDEDAAQRLWERYWERLVRLGRSRLGGVVLKTVDEEDIALSALNCFLDGARKGRFPQLRDRNNLWRLLVVITARKANAHVKRERRLKRAGTRAGVETRRTGNDRHDDLVLQEAISAEPTPEFAVQVAEESARLLTLLDNQTLRNVAQLKLEGYTHQEIATKLGCSVRTVDRKLWRIRAKWSDEIECVK